MEKNNKNTAKAVNRNLRSSPRKVNNLLKNIRGKKADIAIRNLSFARQRIAFEIKKTLQVNMLSSLINSDTQTIDQKHSGKFLSNLTIALGSVGTIFGLIPFFSSYVHG